MKTCIAVLLLAFAFHAQASQRAITDEGDVVILNDDGTWTRESPESRPETKIVMNPTSFVKQASASFLLKSKKNNAAFWIDPKKWSFKKSASNEEAEYAFQLKGKDLYAMAITEEIEIDLVGLAQIALQNARNAAPDARIISQEYRMVNGVKVMQMKISGTLQGIKFIYLGNYFSDKSGSTQFITYTSQGLLEKYRGEIDAFLNGFTLQP